MTTNFNKRNVYEEKVKEKVIEIKKLCHLYKIPMFFTACLENSEKATVYEKEMVSASTCGYALTDDQIAKHVNVTLGFDTVQPSSETVLDMDDIEVNYISEEEEEDE